MFFGANGVRISHAQSEARRLESTMPPYGIPSLEKPACRSPRAVFGVLLSQHIPKARPEHRLVLRLKPELQSFGFAQDKFWFPFPGDFDTGGEQAFR